MSPEHLCSINNLCVTFHTETGPVQAVDGVSINIDAGQIVAIVGESGSGKSVTMQTVMRLIDDPNTEVTGEIWFKGRDIVGAPEEEMRGVRGAEIAMIFQDAMAALNPVYRVGWQIEEQLKAHQRLSKRAARARAIEFLKMVGVPHADRRIDDFPHEFSGGMRQRVMIAMALSTNPSLLIADEPTTALDVTIQAQILDLIERLRDETGAAVALITHDMGVVADVADHVVVMYAGRIAETSSTGRLFSQPQHPYTRGLMESMPRLDRPRSRDLVAIPGQPPSLGCQPPTCNFRSRCRFAFERCETAPQKLEPRLAPDHLDSCCMTVGEKELRYATSTPPLHRKKQWHTVY